MRLLASDAPLPDDLRGAVIALGNFDGFHRGHAHVVGRAVERARAEGRPAIVATFDPHPARYFRPEAPCFRLTTIPQRAALFARAGADATLVLHFDAALAAMSPAAFVRDMLAGRFGAAGVVTGADFTFGHDRAGTVETLRDLGAAQGLTVDTVAPVTDAGEIISSTRIREALRVGDCATATALLGRPFAIRGTVVHGAALGRTIGYPTANLVMRDYLRARYGIYAVRVTLDDGSVYDGAANLGIRPSIDPPLELLEPYLFAFSGDLYDREIEVALIAFLRPEEKFDSLDALTEQMDRDCAQARDILARFP